MLLSFERPQNLFESKHLLTGYFVQNNELGTQLQQVTSKLRILGYI